MTIESPNVLLDRITLRPGIPFRERSIGTVTCRSTSAAAWPGYIVITWAVVSEMSG